MSKETILYIDDEKLNLETFTAVFNKRFNILTSKSANEAFKIVDQNPLLKVIISDQRMPVVTGLEFFNTISKQYPDIICIIVTAYADIDITLQAINQGGIYRYILKPWKKEEMQMAIDNALESFNLKMVNKTLLNNLRHKNEILQESEERYKKLTESTIAGYLITREDEIVYSNNAFLNLTGFNNFDEIADKTIFEIFNSKEIERIINNVIDNSEFIFTNKNGQQKVVLINSTEIDINKKKHVQSTFFDITQLRETQNQLIEAKNKVEKADKLKTAFLTNISHEIRTPLNGIVGFSSLICDIDTTDEEKKEYFEIIRSNSDYLVNMINDVIEISKANANNLDIIYTSTNIFNVLKSIEFTFKNEIEAKKINFEIIENKDIEIVIIDNIIFKKIIYHLVSNAIKFTEKGEITITYHLTPDNNFIEFSVKDTGIGISENEFETIFESFRQLDYSSIKKYQGSGLGLALVKAYLDKMEGKIWLNSKVGVGSDFKFTIPNKSAKEKEEKTNLNLKKQIKKILIADDEEVNLFYLEKALKKINIETIKANNGFEVIEIYKNNPEIDLILMDIRMPKLDGIKALQEIKKINKNIYIIALTAYTEEKNRASILEAGFDYFIEKPVNRKELIDLIKGL